MNQDKPKVNLQLSAVDPAIKRAFMKEAIDYQSPSALFEEMWRRYVASQRATA